MWVEYSHAHIHTANSNSIFGKINRIHPNIHFLFIYICFQSFGWFDIFLFNGILINRERQRLIVNFETSRKSYRNNHSQKKIQQYFPFISNFIYKCSFLISLWFKPLTIVVNIMKVILWFIGVFSAHMSSYLRFFSCIVLHPCSDVPIETKNQ